MIPGIYAEDALTIYPHISCSSSIHIFIIIAAEMKAQEILRKFPERWGCQNHLKEDSLLTE